MLGLPVGRNQKMTEAWRKQLRVHRGIWLALERLGLFGGEEGRVNRRCLDGIHKAWRIRSNRGDLIALVDTGPCSCCDKTKIPMKQTGFYSSEVALLG